MNYQRVIPDLLCASPEAVLFLFTSARNGEQILGFLQYQHLGVFVVALHPMLQSSASLKQGQGLNMVSLRKHIRDTEFAHAVTLCSECFGVAYEG